MANIEFNGMILIFSTYGWCIRDSVLTLWKPAAAKCTLSHTQPTEGMINTGGWQRSCKQRSLRSHSNKIRPYSPKGARLLIMRSIYTVLKTSYFICQSFEELLSSLGVCWDEKCRGVACQVAGHPQGLSLAVVSICHSWHLYTPSKAKMSKVAWKVTSLVGPSLILYLLEGKHVKQKGHCLFPLARSRDLIYAGFHGNYLLGLCWSSHLTEVH